MAKENMQLGEGFSAQKVSGIAQSPEPSRRHYVIGWSAIVAILAALGYFGGNALTGKSNAPAMQEKPGLTEILGNKISGVLNVAQIRDGREIWKTSFPIPNQIINAGETALRDCFGGTGTPTCTVTQAFKYHGLGTSSAAIAETDTGCTTELTTQYNPDSTRATGSQTNNGANIYRTVGTNTVDAGVTINEFCLMSQAATGGGTMWTRILTGAIALSSGDSLQTTYDLTIE
jgi:hypothetical protein